MKKLLLIALALFAFQFSRAQWENDIRLTDTPDTSYMFFGMSHSIAASKDTVHVVWYDKSEGNWEIFYKRSTDGGLNWEQGTRMTDDEARSTTPAISLSGSVVHVVWTDTRDGNREIYYNRSVDGGTNWEGESRLTDDISYSYEPTVSSSGSYVHVVWVNTDLEGFYQVLYKHSIDGGITWGPEYWLSGNSLMAYNPSIATSDSDVYVVWNDCRDQCAEIYYSKSTDNGLSWGPEIRLTNALDLSQLPSIGVSGSVVHIAWEDWRNDCPEIYYKGSVDGGSTWGEDTRVTFNQASRSPNLAVSNSVIHIVWTDYRNGLPDIFYSYSAWGGEIWAPGTKLNDFSSSSTHPFIAVSDTILHVVWFDYRDGNYEIYYKRNPTGGAPFGIENAPLPGSKGMVSISPNPASRQLTVGSRQSSVRLSIVDLYGREIKEFGNVSSFPYLIDISDLSDGVFLLRVMDDEGKSGFVKFLKIAE